MPSDPVKSFPFLFYLQITSGTETRKERSSQTRKGRKRERKNDSQMQRWDRAADLSLSRSPSPFWPGLIVAAPCRSRSCLRANRDRSTTSRDLTSCRTQLPLSLSLPSSLNLTGFDDIFFLGFVCVSVLRNEWYYIFFWQPRKCEKMWATSRKYVFYGIFKNTTKHQKIFFETFFEMQPNTWKYFHFPKIAFPENIYFPENILHETNTALASLFLPPLCCHTNLEWQREH